MLQMVWYKCKHSRMVYDDDTTHGDKLCPECQKSKDKDAGFEKLSNAIDLFEKAKESRDRLNKEREQWI